MRVFPIKGLFLINLIPSYIDVASSSSTALQNIVINANSAVARVYAAEKKTYFILVGKIQAVRYLKKCTVFAEKLHWHLFIYSEINKNRCDSLK